MELITKKTVITSSLLVMLFFSCTKGEKQIDEVKPSIDLSFASAFPKSCAKIKKGGLLHFKARFTDNEALGSYAIDIHNNFDHHTHDNYEIQCDLGPKKLPKRPFIYMKNFSIQGTVKSYEAAVSIPIPNAIDVGDYHFEIRVTDQTGWQRRQAVDIKITE
ncbi:DUF4625 domain-containing protein [Tenacibaculum maritimum]|uniref:DUF4625 domain-containing protein n=1 Tax=Tenacibaculum maritimum TaxID=107401 RepID=UPI00388D2DF9